MKMIDLLEIIQDENSSEDFLRSRGILKTFTHCVKCESTKLGMIRGDRWKCYSCKSEWTRRKDSILSLVRMKYSEFILCMKFFELELTAEETTLQLGLNYRSIQLLFNEFRIILTSFNLLNLISDQNIIREEELIYLMEVDKKILLTNKDSIDAPTIEIKIKRHFIQEGSAFFHFEINNLNKIHNLKISKKHFVLHQFVRFAKKRLFDFRGTGKKNLLLRFSEIVFRFNHPDSDIFEVLTNEILQNFKGG